MLIHRFCKICELDFFVLILSTGRTGRTLSGSQLIQNTWIIKQTLVFLWKYWRKYGPVRYSFSCTPRFSNLLSALLMNSLYLGISHGTKAGRAMRTQLPAAVAAAVHRGFKEQKPAKNYIRKFVKLSGSDLCLQQFDKFLKCSACNHQKRKLYQSAEIDFGRIYESTSGELIFGGF